MAASYVAMNETFGNFFDATRAEAATPAMADERADQLKDQFIMDMHTHFLRDDTRLKGFVAMRAAVGKAGWNTDLAGKEQTIDDLKYDNYVNEVFLDSDTSAIFGGNNAKLYGIEPKKAELDFKNDRLTALKAKYDKAGREPSNLRYGYVAEPVSDFSVFG